MANYYSEQQIKKARAMDLLTYLQTYEPTELVHILDVIDNREEKWTKEVNIVAWNGGKPKIDVRDWNERHDRMSRGITLTEEQGEKLVKALGQRMLDKQKARTERDPYER